nr:hypothetical protein [uncultured Methanoregula sp.]
MDSNNDDYPSMHSWTVITIEGYCMLNVGYGSHKDPYCYLLKPDRSFEQVKNDRYDPSARPDPWPADCHHAVSSDCIPCRHFGWCDVDRHAKQKLHRSRINRPRIKKITRREKPKENRLTNTSTF